MSQHTDDITSYCKTDLHWFLEDDVNEQYAEYASKYVRDYLYKLNLPFLNDVSLVVIRDYIGEYVGVKCAISIEVSNRIDTVLSEILPESVYDEYTSQKREASYYNFPFYSQQFDSSPKGYVSEACIAELFLMNFPDDI